MPKVSVIIPVYNTAPYLRRCLDSVCGQTLQDIEIICVDDASTDGSAEILREYADKDGRVRVLTLPENRGPGAARNAGMTVAQGGYVGFVDSDDYPEKNFYALLLEAAKSSGFDIAKGCYRNSETHHIDANLNAMVREDKTNLSFEFCSCLFRRNFLNTCHIRFPEHLRDMEDPLFVFTAALHCNNVAIVDDAYINIFYHESSSTGGVPNFERVQHKCIGLKMMQKLANTASMAPESYGYVMAQWCIVTLSNTSRNRELRARKYLADAIAHFMSALQYRDAFYMATDVLWNGAGSYLEHCHTEDIPFFIEDMNRRRLEMQLNACRAQLREQQLKNMHLAAQFARSTFLGRH